MPAWITPRELKSGAKSYRVLFRLGGRATRIRYGGSFRTMREAKIRKAWVDGELAARRVPDLALLNEPAPAPTLAKAAARWQASRVDVAEGTPNYHRTALNHSLRFFGTRGVDTITGQDVADMVAALHAEGAKRESIRKVVNVLAMVLDFERIAPNPARDKLTVKLPREEPEQIDPPVADDVEAVFRLLPSVHLLPELFLDWSGVRVGAIDKTLVSDYDESRRRVRLRAATTKTRRALWIELPDVLADAIEAALPPREDRDPEARLFAGSGSDALRTAIGKACAALGIASWSPHDLRHRRISLLHAQGMTWAQIGERVGSRNIAVLAQTYTHVLLDDRELDYETLLRSRSVSGSARRERTVRTSVRTSTTRKS